MSNWEYTTEKVELVKGFNEKLKSKLNTLGKVGWELCWVRELENCDGERSITCILKREIPQKSPHSD